MAEACAHSWSYGGWDGIGPAEAVRVGCDRPYWLRCSLCGERRLARCGKASERSCGPCSRRGRARVGLVAGSGLVVGRLGLFVTLTAPSWRPHFLPDGSACRCTGGGCEGLAEWNADAGRRWNRFVRDLKRHLGTNDLAYFKATEIQRRGAIHYHFLLRRDDGLPLAIRKGDVRRLAMKHGFGHSVDVQRVEPGHASYVAKYASKAAGERADVPWRGQRWAGGYRLRTYVDASTGEVCTVRVGRAERCRVLSLTPTYRTWSCSRGWGESMASIRAAQGHHEAVLACLPSWVDNEPRPVWALAGAPARPGASDPPD